MIYSNLQEQLMLELASSLSLLRGQGKRHLLFFPSESLKNYYQTRLAESLETTVDIDCCLISEIFEQSLEIGLLDQSSLQGAINEFDFEWALTQVLSRMQKQLQAIEDPPKTSSEYKDSSASALAQNQTDLLLPPEVIHSPLAMELRQETSNSLYRLIKTLTKSFSRYSELAASSHVFYKPGDWQSFIWQQVLELLSPKASYVQLIEQLIEGSLNKKIEGLHFYFVGFSRLPPILLNWIQTLAVQYPVEWLLLSPCRLFWSDSGSFFSNQHALAKAALKTSSESLNQLEALLFDRHPLLANMAIAAKPLTQFLENYQTTSHDAYVLPTDPHFHDAYLDLWWQDAPILDESTTLLRALQLDFLLLRTLDPDIKAVLNPDKSLIIHQCPDPDREVALLKAYILKQLADDPSLHLGDILILAPNIHEYRGLIERHFEKTASMLPYRLHDTRQINPQGVIYALQTLLTFAKGTWSFSNYCQLLSLEPFSKKYDTKKIINFLEKAQAICTLHWGIDAEHHLQLAHQLGLDSKEGLESTSWQTFWKEVMAYLLEGSEHSKLNLKLSYWGSSTLEECLELHQKLLEALKPWYRRQELSLKAWIEQVQSLLEVFFISESQDVEKDRLEELFFSFQPSFKTADSPLISCETFYDLLIRRLEAIQLPWSHLSENALRFSSMQPMRSVPAKHLCILGLSSDMRSRFHTPSHFEWSPEEGIAQMPGQMTLDRYSFLESILSARDSLHLFYSQAKATSQEDSIEPSYLISELISYLDQAFIFSDGDGLNKKFSDWLHLKHNDELPARWPFTELFASEKERNPLEISLKTAADIFTQPNGINQELLITKKQIVDLLTDPLAFHLRQNLKSIRSFYVDSLHQEHLLSADWALESSWETLAKQNSTFFDSEKESFSPSFEKILSKQKPSSLGMQAWKKKYQAIEKRKSCYWRIQTSPIFLNLSLGFDVLQLPDRIGDQITSRAFTLSAFYPWKINGEIGWIDPIHPYLIVHPQYKDKRIEGIITYILAHHLGLLETSSLMIYFLDEKKLPQSFDLSTFDTQAWLDNLAKSAHFFKQEMNFFHIKLLGYLTQKDAKSYLKSLIKLTKETSSSKRISLFLSSLGVSLEDETSERLAGKWLQQAREYLLPLYAPFLDLLGLKEDIEEEEGD